MCFLKSIQICLQRDFNEHYTLTELKDKIVDELVEHVDFYADFHDDVSKGQLIRDSLKYLNENQYTLDVVDVVVMACGNALKSNLYILSRSGGDALMVAYTTRNATNRNLFLKYNRHGGNVHGADHYSPIVDKVDACDNISVNLNEYQSKSQTNTNNETVPSESSFDEQSNSVIDPVIDRDTDQTINTFDDSNDTDVYYDEYGMRIDCTQSEIVYGDNHQDIMIPDPQQVIVPTNLDVQSQPVSEDTSDEDLLYNPPHVLGDGNAKEIPEEFRKEKRNRKRKYQKTSRMNPTEFDGVEKEMVNSVPWNVDGTHWYEIQCEADEWLDHCKDGRWFRMNTSGRKGFKGKRKTGVCNGSMMCENTSCTKLLTTGVCNTNEFTFDSGAYVCKCCGYYGVVENCGCKKIIEYDEDKKLLSVWYEGKHNCHIKPDVKTKTNFLNSLPLNTDCLQKTPRELKMDLFKILMLEGKINEAVKVTRQMDDPTLIEKMRYMAKWKGVDTGKPEDEMEAFRCITNLRKASDEIDKNLIYAVNCRQLTGEPSYVFKTHKHALDLAVQMDPTRKSVRGRRSLLASEKAYFDGMHRRCRGYKTLTMWVHHPGMRRMRRLATMEVEKENTKMVTLFFNLFNKALAEHVGDKNYKFNPILIMTDEAGANLQGIKEAMGEDYPGKIVTCQWHFKQCAWRQLSKIREEDKPAFVEAVHRLCGVTTMHDNQKYSSIIEVICHRNRVLKWWKWWKVRGYHIFPALRGYGWTGSNWAEIGHSTLRRSRKVWLVEATVQDIASAIMEENEYIAFIENRGKVVGKGPTALKKKMNERKAMRAYTQSAADALLHGDITKEIDNYDPEAANFLPKRSAKHRVPKIFSTKNPVEKHLRGKKPTKSRARSPVVEIDTEESEVEENQPEQIVIADDDDDANGNQGDDEADDVSPEPIVFSVPNPVTTRRMNPKRKLRGKNRKYDSMVDVDDDDELAKYDNIQVPRNKERMKLSENPPVYVFMRPAIKRCNGCRALFDPIHRKPPHDLIFRYVTHRTYKDPVSGQWVTADKPGNAYYHARDLLCLKREHALESVEPNDLFIEESTYARLSREHKKLLIKRKHWTPLRESRRNVIDN